MSIEKQNLFKDLAFSSEKEMVDVLWEKPMVERILSHGQTTDWQKSDRGEFVLLLQGEGELDFGDEKMILTPGDWCFIPARTRHRVSRTEKETLWLCVWETI